MKNWDTIVGNEEIIKHFQDSIQNDKLSHAYIINGEKSSGKALIARIFASTVQCEERGTTPCGVCHSCVQAESRNHPDIIWVQHEKPTVISVDDVREQITNDVSIKPYSSPYKIYIVKDAQLMNPQAQNAILKTIEEPPEYAIIILLTTNSNRLLPTICSRCVQLNMKPVRDRLVIDYLVKHENVDEDRARFCAGFAFGNMGKAIRLARTEAYDEIIKDTIWLMTYLYEMDMTEVIDAVKTMTKYKLEINDLLDLIMVWYRDILLVKVTASPDQVMFKNQYLVLSKQASHVSYEGVECVLKALDKAKVRLDANVNFDTVMELLLLTIKEN